MLVKRIPLDLQITDAAGNPMGVGRSAGIHQSAVIRRHAEDLNLAPDDIVGEQEYVRMHMGFVWERAIEEAFKRQWVKQREVFTRGAVVAQGEIECDGIYMTPDGLDIDEWVLEEYKATWKSSRRLDTFEKDFWHWLMQMKGYARCLGTNRARLYVFFVNGNYSYKQGQGPQVFLLEFEWSDGELAENWNTIKRVAEKMRREQEGAAS